MAVIVIDPGHGGNTVVGGSSPNNATGPNGTKEKEMTLRIAVATAEKLNQLGQQVILTRNADTNLGLRDRALVAFDNNAAVFVSIHFNGDANPTIQGTETYIHPAALTPASKRLGSSLQLRLVEATGYTNRGLKSNDYGVLNPGVHRANTAACLIEISFLTNPQDEVRLQQANYRLQVAEAISRAIIDFLNNATSITPLNIVIGSPPANEGDG